MSQDKLNRGREIITINVGGCGVGLGQRTLEQYCTEQGISKNGTKHHPTQHDDTISISFKETSKAQYIARSLFIDLDPYPIHYTKHIYSYNKLLNNSYLINGKTSATDIFARGHYVDGKEIIDKVSDTIRLSVEECDHLQGFIFNHSLSGGTGGGVGALILERLAVDYRKKCKFAFEIFFDNYQLTAATHVYNTLLSLHWSMDHTETSIIIDNTQLHHICRNRLGIKAPRYKHYNGLCTQLMSNITAPFRFGFNHDDLMSFSKDMTPFPRLHWLTSSLSPCIPKVNNMKMKVKYKNDIQSLTDKCIQNENFFHRCSDFDAEEDKYIAMMLSYRGDGIDKHLMEMNTCIESLIKNRKVNYIDWTASNKPSMKCVNSPTVSLPSDDILVGDKQVLMVGNNTCIDRLFQRRIADKYDMLYSQRAYVHFFVGWGMEEGEFAEAREDLGFLSKDYLDVMSVSEDHDYDDEIDDDENI